MSRGDESAYPWCDEHGTLRIGMTIRERFAMAAMQGLLANRDSIGILSSTEIIDTIMCYADALLAELEKGTTDA